MKVVKTLKPDAPGAKRFQDEWGEYLVAVRYRKNSNSGTHLTTIEVIVDERMLGVSLESKNRALLYKNTIVAIKIPIDEQKTREQLIQMGAIWNNKNRVWFVTYKIANTLGLTENIVLDINDFK